MNAVERLLGAAALAQHGGRVALHCADEVVTYAELAGRVRRGAAAWRALGVAPGDRVLILLRDTPAFAAAWLGAVYAGAVAIAVNGKLSADDQRYMFEDSDARLFLVEDALADVAKGVAGGHCVPLSAWLCVPRELEPQPFDRPQQMQSEDPAFWLYSSGTTGRPKGIAHAHKDILPAGQAMRQVLGLKAGDTVFGTSRLFFAYGLEHGLLGALSIGARSILHPDAADADQVRDIVTRHQPDAFFSVPSFYRRLLLLGSQALEPFRAVRYFVAAGERLPAQMLEQWRSATGGEILSLYGMSETFCVAAMTPPGASLAARTGRPLAGVDIRLLNESGAEAATGEPGVLWIRHPSLTTGYMNRPQATSEQFVDGWFCTKDVFVRDAEGFLSHQGRVDEFIKVAGQWVQPGELEEAVVSDPSIGEAVCVCVNDADGFERLALFVVAAEVDAGTTLSAASRACEQNLPRHKRPKWIRTVAELPRTATGKVQRFKLRELLERELVGRE